MMRISQEEKSIEKISEKKENFHKLLSDNKPQIQRPENTEQDKCKEKEKTLYLCI